MEYFEASEKQLQALMGGLNIIERLNPEKAAELNICIYGLTSDYHVIELAKEAIIEDAEKYYDHAGDVTLSTSDVELPEVALCIKVSADTIWAMSGSGIDIYNIEFAYASEEGEGVRSGYFRNSNTKRAQVSLKSFKKIVLAEDDFYLRKFLQKYGSNTAMMVKKKVERTVPAAEAVNPQPGITASSTINLKEALDKFLG